ncbi:MAG: response regulator [Lysobacter sp.]|nr:MAG: response regulator [Lysobacter sp.]
MTEPSTRVLLVEDDPVSAAFLRAALERVPARVDVAGNCARARALARNADHALWVIDAHLPDGRGEDVLATLRAAGLTTPAIAHTAAREAEQHERLLAAGFLEVLVKPLSASEILSAARIALNLYASPVRANVPVDDAPLWDDVSALDALLGDRSHMDALRRLFLADLRSMRVAVANAVETDDEATLHAVLHRLRASCGFVGAVRLCAAVQQFAAQDAVSGWPAFDLVAAQTLAQAPVDEEG